MNFNPLKVFFVKFLFCFFNSVLSVVRKILFFARGLPESISNILIYRIGNIGDIICAIPAMISVREHFPNAHITLLTSPLGKKMPGAKELLQGADFLDEMIIYYHDEVESWRGVLSLVKSLRKNRYDLFIELPNDLATLRIFIRDMIFARAIGCKDALGFKINTLPIFLRQQAKHLQFNREVERLLSILAKERFTTNGITFRLPIRKEDILVIDRLFEEYKVNQGDFCISINPGAKRPSNRWPKERFVTVAKALRECYDARILITGGLGDVELVQWIAGQIGDSAIPVAGKTTLLQSAELLRRCELLITNDTGTMHLAAAMETPLVAIFSARDFPGKWYPYGSENIILRKSVSCELCYKFSCSMLDCLKAISVEEVLQAVDSIFKRSKQKDESFPCAVSAVN